jgi:AcrR family transcriptional regulator
MTTAARGPYRTGIKRRRDILAAAAEVFGQYGYAGGSLRQIADQVGVTSAALIRHFGSKEALLIALLEYWNEETRHVTAGLDRTGLDFFDALEEVMEYHTTHRGLLELFLTVTVEASNPDHPARDFITDRYKTLVSQGTAALGEAVRVGDVRPLTPQEQEWEVRGLFAAMDGIEMQWMLDPELDLVAAFRYTYARILEGWGVRRGTPSAG